MWRLRDHFEWLHQIPGSGSVAFLCKKRIDLGSLPDLTPESFALDEIDQAYDYSLTCVPEEQRRSHIETAKLLFLLERSHDEAALKQARRLVQNKIKLQEHVLADARGRVEALLVREKMAPKESHDAHKLELLTEIGSLLPDL